MPLPHEKVLLAKPWAQAHARPLRPASRAPPRPHVSALPAGGARGRWAPEGRSCDWRSRPLALHETGQWSVKFHSHDLPRVPPRLLEQNSGCPCQRGSRCRADVPGGGWPARRGRAGWRAAAHRPGPAPAPLLRAAGCRARPGSAPVCGPQAGPSQAWLTERRQLGHPGRSSLPPPRSWRHQPPTLRNTGRPPPRCADGRTRSSCRGGPWDSDPCSPPPQSHLLRDPGRLREGPTGTCRASSASCCCMHAQRPTPRPGSPRLLQGSRCLPPAGTARRQCWAGPGPGRGGREGRGGTGAGRHCSEHRACSRHSRGPPVHPAGCRRSPSRGALCPRRTRLP